MSIKKAAFLLAMIIIVSFCLFISPAVADNISIEVQFDKTSYTIGETITVSYAITGGSGSYSSITCVCYSSDNAGTIPVRTDKLTAPSGTISFTPTSGQQAYVYFEGHDSDGRFFNSYSDRVTLSGGTTVDPISVNVSFDKASYTIGETITVSYAITGGSGSYSSITCICYRSDNAGTIPVRTDKLTAPSGTISFTPTVGQQAHVYFEGRDSDNRYFNFRSDRVTLSGEIPADSTPASTSPQQTAEPANPAGPTEKVTLSKLKSVKLKALSAKKIEVKWKKLSKKDQKKIQKIEIQYSTDKTFKTYKTKWAKKTKSSVKISGLKKNTKYWVRIRAYKKSGNIIYVSKWVTKSKKTKKK